MPARFAGRLAAAVIALSASAALAESEDRLRASFASADRNNDGFVDVDEYVAHVVAEFAELDTNRDELLMPADVPDVDPARFAEADRDGDGRVSLSEAVAERMIAFFEADRNRDGLLSLEEVLAAESMTN